MVTTQVARSLLRSQKNDVMRAIRIAGLNPADFGWDEVASGSAGHTIVPRLVHVPTRSWFAFDGDGAVYASHFWPSSLDVGYSEGPVALPVRGDWRNQLACFMHWLKLVRRELSEPDLWSVFSDGSTYRDESDADNSPFNPAERDQIIAQLGEVRRYIVATGVDETQLLAIDARLDYLTEATERLGRIDWRVVAIGMAFEIALAAAFNPEQARHLFDLMAQAAQRLLGA